MVTLFGVTVFLGAFLLFQVQLVIGKYILPWYGGVPMVWTICMLCFQVLLLAGYAYAHLLVRRLPDRSQRRLHVTVIVLSLAALGLFVARWGVPLLPSPAWKPGAGDIPTWHIVQVLAVAVGAPFFVVATTAPLIQSWFAGAFPISSPYRLYALSNLGSLIALLSYPALVEVWLPIRAQAWLWTAGFVLFAVGVGACAAVTSRVPTRSEGATLPTASDIVPPPPRVSDWLLWLALSGAASALLLATTNYVSQEIAVIPFLWIIPLSLYLTSFVLTFDSERWYARGPWAVMLALGITLSAFVLERDVWAHVLLQIGVAAFTLFAACMVCHGELARTKPAASHLTSFYLAITIGGALGGASRLARRARPVPRHMGVPARSLDGGGAGAHHLSSRSRFTAPRIAAVDARRRRRGDARRRRARVPAVAAGEAGDLGRVALRNAARRRGRRTRVTSLGLVAPAGGADRPCAAAARLAHDGGGGRRRRHRRSRAGACRVETARQRDRALTELLRIVHVEVMDPDGDGHEVRLRHGRIVHGKQYRSPAHVREPTSYYGRDSGVGSPSSIIPVARADCASASSVSARGHSRRSDGPGTRCGSTS